MKVPDPEDPKYWYVQERELSASRKFDIDLYVEDFRKWKAELRKRLRRLESLRAGSIYSEEQEEGMKIILREILGEEVSEE